MATKTVIKETLSSGSSDFVVANRSVVSGARLGLAATIYANSGSVLELQGDLGDGNFVKLADITAEAAAVLPRYNAEVFRITGSGTFILNSEVQLAEL